LLLKHHYWLSLVSTYVTPEMAVQIVKMRVL